MNTRTLISLALVSIAVLVLSSDMTAATGAEVYWTIDPGDYESEIIPKDNDFQRSKITLTSSIPVDIYVLNNDQYLDFQSAGYVTSSEQEHKGRSDFVIEYVYPDDNVRWLVAVNPSEMGTANVVVSNDLIIKGLDDDGIDKDDAACGSFMLAGTLTLFLLVLILVAIKKKN